MLRIRLLRLLLPALFVLLAYLLWSNWKPNPRVHREPTDSAPTGEFQADNLSVKEFIGSGSTFDGDARVVQPRDDGSLHLEGIEELTIHREDRGPLLVSAESGDRTGPEGSYRWHFEDEVVFREVDRDLRLTLPVLDIDQAAGEARSFGDIRFDGPDLEGSATALVYGLNGQPGELTDPALSDAAGSRITSRHARLLDGIRDVELIGNVDALRDRDRLTCSTLRLLRGTGGRLEQALATGDVRGQLAPAAGEPVEIRGERLELRWSESGEVEVAGIEGEAFITRGTHILSAQTIEVVRDTARSWKIAAAEGVFAAGEFGGAPGRLRSDRLLATLDHEFVPTEAEALGQVSFEGQQLRAEAERATFVGRAGADGDVELFGDERHKARLAQGRTRVAARTIRTGVRGEQLSAEGLVEATLLPQEGEEEAAPGTRLFSAGQAIHFVSERLESRDSGQHLTFTGSARGWQGERNLSAGKVVVDQRNHHLEAEQSVSTRVPREASGAVATEGDYIQIGADHLRYDEAGGIAVYTGKVRVRLVEGWLDAERVEVELAKDGREVHEIRAFDSVRIEFQRTAKGEMSRPVSGTSDRLLYDPAEAVIRLYGDLAPAVVRRMGEGGGTTAGRELHYRVDTGTLSVESGEQGSGRIRS